MRIFWSYLKPYHWWLTLALVLAGSSQILALYDPVIFGKLIDQYALNPQHLAPKTLVNGATGWLVLAIVVALLSRIAATFKEYVMRLIVQKFGMKLLMTGYGKPCGYLMINLKRRAAVKLFRSCKKCEMTPKSLSTRLSMFFSHRWSVSGF